MFLGTVNGKINRRKGRGYVAYNFLIVKNRRHPASGHSGYETVWNFGTIRSYELAAKASAFWSEVELVLKSLADNGRIWNSDADKIRKQYERYVNLHASAAPVTVAKPAANPAVAERVKGRVGNLL